MLMMLAKKGQFEIHKKITKVVQKKNAKVPEEPRGRDKDITTACCVGLRVRSV